MMKTIKYTAVLILLFALSSHLLADTVYLKSGRVLNGKIVGQTRKVVRIKTRRGLKVIPKKKIRKLSFGKYVDPAKKRAEELKKKREETRRKKKEEAQRKQKEEKERLLKEKEDLEKRTQEAKEARLREQEEKELEKKQISNRKSKDQQIKDYYDARKRRAKESARIRALEIVNGPYLKSALLRSVLIPGWGQYYQGRTSRAWLVGGSFVITLGASANAERRHNIASNRYEKHVSDMFVTSPLFLSFLGITVPDATPLLANGFLQAELVSKDRLNMQRMAKSANVMRVVLASVYVWNLVDVVLYHPQKNQSLNLRSKSDGFDLSYGFHF